MGKKDRDKMLTRFDLMLPKSIVKIIETMADHEAIPPRTLARSLLVKKVKEVQNDTKKKS